MPRSAYIPITRMCVSRLQPNWSRRLIIRVLSRSVKPAWIIIVLKAIWNGSVNDFAPTSVQLAACGKPLIIHTRSAAEDTLRLMREEGADVPGGVMHCFTESIEVASAALDLGFHISFSGIVTFKNAKALKEVACFVPMDRMLIETDSPYLAPVPVRGKTNQPGFVKHVAEEIARLRGIPVETVAAETTRNFFRLFKLAT